MLTLLTPTTGRPLCFSILEGWIKRQTRGFDQWLVVGENLDGYNFTMGQQVLKRKPKAKETLPSLCSNMLHALPYIKGAGVLQIEDDDYYSPEYIETVGNLLVTHELAGVGFDLYYKLRSKKFKRMGNACHCSLAASAWRSCVNEQIERCCTVHKSVFIDMYLWAESSARDDDGNPKYRSRIIQNKDSKGKALHVGIKQMPGPAGLGNGHTDEGAQDHNYKMLAEWIGMEDSRVYRNIPKTAWQMTT